jgi:hypothetical protein
MASPVALGSLVGISVHGGTIASHDDDEDDE